MSALIDQAGNVRPGEELDAERLDAWLKQQLPHLEGAPEITQFSGGASNWTYRLQYTNDDLILRRPPAGTKAEGAHDMGREYRIQKALKPVFPYVPDMKLHCTDDSVLGAEFYVMQRLVGIIPRKNLPRDLVLSEATVRQLCLSMLDTFIALHKVDYQGAELADIGAGAGYTERQIRGWAKRYRQAKTWNVPSGDFIIGWLEDHLPSKEQLCVTHNDFRFDNLVLDTEDPTRVIGVLDWELATIGDPLMDLGNSLAYWVQQDDDFLVRSARRQPTHLPGMLSRREVVEYYCDKTGFNVENWAFYEVYGLFRLSVIVQAAALRVWRTTSSGSVGPSWSSDGLAFNNSGFFTAA